MAKHRFKAGDFVKGVISSPYFITNYNMTKAVVTEDENINGYVKIEVLEHKGKGYKGQEFITQAELLEKIDETIVIYRKDKETVVALDKSTGKQAEAKCSPVDKFDFHTGAELAFNRLLNKEETRAKETYYNGTIQLLDKWTSNITGERVDIIDISNGKFKHDTGTFPLKPLKPFKNFEEVKEYFLHKFTSMPIRVAEIEKENSRLAEIGEYIQFLQETPSVSIRLNVTYKVVSMSFFYLDVIDVNAGGVIRIPRSHADYTILKGYKETEKFKPYLIDKRKSEFCGNIGDTTLIKDVIDRPLRIGDTVELYDKYNCSFGEVPIIEAKGKAIVDGIMSECNVDGTIEGGWKIILKRKFEDIADGEKVGEITYVKKER